VNRPVLVAGVDEAGRGPLAGAVFAAAVILDPRRPVPGLGDSKTLPERKRADLEPRIRRRAVAWSVAWASVEEIDRLNILQASLLAMKRAVENLGIAPELVLVDGNATPGIPYPAKAVVRGDSRHAEISAASILAKQARDREMVDLADRYPQYGFERHKGYPTRAHLQALREHGATAVHRRSFAPVRKAMDP